jgi:hypothetical protein
MKYTLGIIVLFVSLSSWICSYTYSQTKSPRITKYELGVGLATDDFQLVKATTEFTSDVPRIVGAFQVEDVSVKTNVKGVWVAEDSGDVAPPNYEIAEKILTISDSSPVTFSLSKPTKGWPTGKYRLDVYINDKLAKSVAFNINPSLDKKQDKVGGGNNNALIGAWRGREGNLLVKNDGILIYKGETYNYTIQNKMINLTNNEESLLVPYQLTNDTLVVEVNDQPMTFTRTSEDELGTESHQTNSNGHDLVGKWCYMANVNASNGGRMSNRCFTLYENGTYEYYSETSSSGAYGSSASQESDSGTWTATETSITANSQSMGTITYSLEKRNHPKTGDPMLVIDGDAYVTFNQRPSW